MTPAGAESSDAGPTGSEGRGFRRLWWLGLVLVLLSRVCALFDGPWEADEALFSLGVMNFHVLGHRPHPPGFPGFVFSGRAVAWVVGDPLLALRVVSIAGSILGLVAMDRLLGRIVRPQIAAVTTLAFAMVPGVWAHSARAFTTTPALGLVLAAGWVWQRRRDAGESEPGPWPWLLIAFALTMRPQFVIPLTVLVAAIGVVALSRRGPRVLVWPALWATAGAVIVAGVYAAVASDSGGFEPYLAALRQHAGQHGRAIAGESHMPEFERLCLVRVMGGVWGFGLITAVAGIGAGLAFRISVGFGLTSLAVVGATTLALIYAHHPAFPRYSVIWVAALMPWVALSLDALAPWPRRTPLEWGGFGVALGLLGAVVGALFAWPAIAHMRRHPLPAVAAIDLAVAEGARELLHSPGTSPFVRLIAESPRSSERGADQLAHETLPRDRRPGRYAALLQADSVVLDGATVLRDRFEIDTRAARNLGQDRYDQAVLVRQGVVLGAEMYRVERDPSGQRFVWLGESAELWPPASRELLDRRLVLDLLVVPDRAPQRLEARCEGGSLGSWTLDAGPAQVELALVNCGRSAVELALPDAEAGGPEARPLSLRLVRAWVEGTGIRVADRSWSLGDRDALAQLGVELEGLYNPENFGSRQGRWLAGEGSIAFPAEPGTIELTLARPPFLEAAGEVTITTDSDRYSGGLDDQPMTIRLETTAPGGRVEIELGGPSFVPAERREASSDRRELAMIVYTVSRTAQRR